MMNFLLGWCVVSLLGTALALSLIRSGKRSHRTRRTDEVDEPQATQSPSAKDIQGRTER